jgi:hypothetical protein
MFRNGNQYSPSQSTDAINNRLTIVIGLTNMLERRLCRAMKSDGEARQIVCQIREAAVAATIETDAMESMDVDDTSKTYVEIGSQVAENLGLF